MVLYETIFECLAYPPNDMIHFNKLYCLCVISLLSQVCLADLPNDPLVRRQSHLFSLHGGVGAPEAWEIADGMGIPGEVVVAIVSSGIRTDHEDLKEQLWVNADEIADNGIDDDGNGYVDDIHGWNFVSRSPNVEDTHGEGTFYAGIIAAEQNNGLGVTGLAPNAKIMSLVVIEEEDESGWLEDDEPSRGRPVTTEMIQYAIHNGAKVIVLSAKEDLSGIDYQTLVPELRQRNCHMVVPFLSLPDEPSLINAAEVINCEWTDPFNPVDPLFDYFGRLKVASHLVEFAVGNLRTASTHFEDVSSYIEAECDYHQAVLGGIIAFLKGVYPMEDTALLTTRLLDSARKHPQLEEYVSSGGYPDFHQAMLRDPQDRIQTIDVKGVRDYSAGEEEVHLEYDSSSGLPVSLELLEGPAELTDDRIFLSGDSGKVIIRFTQPGNELFREANPREFSFLITPEIKLIPIRSVERFNEDDIFNKLYSGLADVSNDTMVQSRYYRANENERRTGQVRKRNGDQWELTGYLELPDDDLERYSGWARTVAAVDGDWAAILMSSSDYEDPLGQTVYIYNLEEGAGPYFPPSQSIRVEPLNSIMNIGSPMMMAGRWLAFWARDEFDLGFLLYRRDDEGQYEPVELPGGRYSRGWALSENYAARITEDYIAEIYRTGDNPLPELVHLLKLEQWEDRELAMSDDWIALGLPKNSDRHEKSGAVDLYKRGAGDEFQYHQRIYPDNAQPQMGFGGRNLARSISIGSEYMAVAAPGSDQYIYKWNGQSDLWELVYRTRVEDDADHWYSDSRAFSVSVQDSQLTVWRAYILGHIDLNNALRVEQNPHVSSGVPSGLFVDNDALAIEVESNGTGELTYEVLSGPAHFENNELIVSGDVGEVVFRIVQLETWDFEQSKEIIMTLPVTRHGQTIDWPIQSELIYADSESISLNASASSGLAVEWELIDGEGRILDNILRLSGASGDFSVQATQPGDWRFLPAEPVSRSFIVLPLWRKPFDSWVADLGWTGADADPFADPDGDGENLLATYLFDRETIQDAQESPIMISGSGRYQLVEVACRQIEEGLRIILEKAGSPAGPWVELKEIGTSQTSQTPGLIQDSILMMKSQDPVYLRIVARP